jgi:hypothetical protein
MSASSDDELAETVPEASREYKCPFGKAFVTACSRQVSRPTRTQTDSASIVEIEDRLGRLLCRDIENQATGAIDDEMVDAAFEHRVHLLLLDAQRRQVSAAAPAPFASRVAALERHAVGVELIRSIELRRVLDLLALSGVRALIFKGAALAYSYYREPHLRPRQDVDLLIRCSDVEAAERGFASMGYTRTNLMTGETAMPQRQYRRRCRSGVDHVYDVHSRLANPVLFASALSFEEIDRCAVPIPSLGVHARGPCVVHALLIACMHRVAHHNDSPQLVWLYDIHALAAQMSVERWLELEVLAEKREVRGACWRGLTLASRSFGTPIPPRLLDRLAEGRHDASSAFIGGRNRELAVQWSNWRRLKSWTDRRQLLIEQLLPSPSYMMAKYGLHRRLWLPAFYAHRAVTGAFRWLRPMRG